MKPYSHDLRKRVLAKAQAGKQTQAAIATIFDVSLSTVEKWLRRKRETGKTTPLPPAHGPTRALQDCAAVIRAEVKQQPDLTLRELCARVASIAEVEVSPSTMCRELQQLHLPRKKSRSTIASGTRPASDASDTSFRSGSLKNGSRSCDT
jgi:transposase